MRVPVLRSLKTRARVRLSDAPPMSAPPSLGKGAWCCDTDTEITPERECEVFEEIATEAFAFHGMPTVPPRRNRTHVAAFFEGRRFRVRVDHDGDDVGTVLRRMWDGGLGRDGRVPRHGGAIRAVPAPECLALFHAGRPLDRTKTLEAQGVPRGCKTLACLDTEKTKPGPDSAYWN